MELRAPFTLHIGWTPDKDGQGSNLSLKDF